MTEQRDAVPIRCPACVSLDSVRAQIAVVSQSPFLFNGTIWDNIALGHHGASDELIIDAAKGAFAHEFIMNFEKGYQTLVGEDGSSLSGGQRQRIALARAILKGSKILLLDEATSSLDVESELTIQRAINALYKSKTIIVIAHRLQTIQNANKIVFIQDGEVRETGSHQALLSNKGRYHDFNNVYN